jgi:four helix bundle protein
MGTIESYKDLIVYKKAYDLALAIYEMTKVFPESERFGLTSQLRRCSVSIPSNIAEGYRRGKKEYVQFLKIAYGSCAELETQLALSRDLGFVRNEEKMGVAHGLQNEVSKMLGTMVRKIGSGGNRE